MKNKVSDPVKASDRGEVLDFFGLQQQTQQEVVGGEWDNDMMQDTQEEDRKVDQQRESSSKSRDSGDKKKRHKEKHSKATKEEKKEKQPITNEQVMQKLDALVGKRGENRKVKQEDVAMMEEMANASQQNKPNDILPGQSSLRATPAAISTTPHEKASVLQPTPESEDLEKQLILAALSATGYEINDQAVVNDRPFTDKITSSEHPVGDSKSILCFPSRDFTDVLNLYLEFKKLQDRGGIPSSNNPSSKKHPRPSSSSRRHHQPPPSSVQNKKLKKPNGYPIIIIPNAMTSPITMINAQEFFSQAKFIPRDILLQQQQQKSRQSSIIFERRVTNRLGGGLVKYEIIDNPKTKFKSNADWDRVVAVIPQGAEWQFKGWKYQRPVDVFTKYFGFYVGMEGAPIPKEITQWNVKLGFLNRDKRGLDSVAFASFWNSLDEWMAIHKPEYLPSNPMTS